eukprot:scaffold290172_cov24-Tisochrysis_lutea.AAC.1
MARQTPARLATLAHPPERKEHGARCHEGEDTVRLKNMMYSCCCVGTGPPRFHGAGLMISRVMNRLRTRRLLVSTTTPPAALPCPGV